MFDWRSRRAAVNEIRAIREIHELELLYLLQFGRYGNLNELAGLPAGTREGSVQDPCYVSMIRPANSRYEVVAQSNCAGVRNLYSDESGAIREGPGGRDLAP